MRLAVGLSHRLSSIKVHEEGVMHRLESGVKGHVLISRLSWCGKMALGGLPAPPPVSLVPESSFIQGGAYRHRALPVRR